MLKPTGSPVLRRPRLCWAGAAFGVTWLWMMDSGWREGPAVMWPSLLAIGLAFLTRDILVALAAGAFSGAVLLHGGNPVAAFPDLFAGHLLPALANDWNISVLVFTLLMGGLVEMLNRNGGMAALANGLIRRGMSRRRAGLGVYALGWVMFVDGLANAMLIGKSLRPVTDRAGMSREKLAFLVDSTASPIAGLALISTWVAYELSVIREGLGEVTEINGEAVSALGLLVASLPFRYYNVFLLLLVFLAVWWQRDFRAMASAEENAARLNSERKVEPELESPTADRPDGSRAFWLAGLPIAMLVGGVLLGLFWDGGGFGGPWTMAGAIEAFGQANAARVFVWVTAAVVLATAGLGLWRAPAAEVHPLAAFQSGMQEMFLPALVLVLAWTLNSVIQALGADDYLVTWLGPGLPPGSLPALVFLVAAGVSFSTGTSWGTMALVMPLAVRLGLELGAAEPGLLAPTVGAVLAGAVFGDHCSPLSDTTLVSAISSGCEPLAHVRTQLPYALTAASGALVLGYVPAGWGGGPWGYVGLLLGGAACGGWLWYRGRAVSDGIGPGRSR